MLRLALLLAENVAGATLPDAVRKMSSPMQELSACANQCADRLPHVDDHPLSLFQRAVFRIKMRGGGIPGLTYLLRLSLSPTEEDWLADSSNEKQSPFSAIERPLRLARKYSRSQK